MNIIIRPFTSSDANFIESLIPCFSEFDLPAWRQRDEIDNTNLASLKKAMETPEPGSAIYIAEDETGKRAGFVHLQIQTDYFNGEKVAYISDLAVDSSFEGQGIGGASCSTKPKNGHASKAVICFRCMYSPTIHGQEKSTRNSASTKKSRNTSNPYPQNNKE